MPWLMRGDDVLAAAEVAVTRKQRRRGLAGRDVLEGVMVLRPCRQVHTFGMRFPIDVVWCDAHGQVLRVARMKRARVSRPVLRARFVIETEAGCTRRWGIHRGDVVEVVDGGCHGG